jgi:dipeptidyl-peptidase-4
MGMDQQKASIHGGKATHAYDARMTAMETAPSFPRQAAATRRFRLGMPRGFQVSPDGARVAFIRSAGGRDPVGSLWVGSIGDDGLIERCVVDAGALVKGHAALPAAEKARRERMRETTSGITAFSTDAGMSRAVFSLDGVPYVVDLVQDGVHAQLLAHPGPIVDPRMSPDGTRVSFVCDRSVYLVPTGGGVDATVVCASEDEHESWGLADFIAAEELHRHRGLWWLPDGSAFLAEQVDESDVAVRWIGDPARPEQQPRPHRYPAAGSANPVARLHLVRVDGTRTEIEWDHDAYPYLATVEAGDPRAAIISVLSRDQQHQLILRLDSGETAPTPVKERTTAPWLTMHGGVPCLAPDGTLLEVVANVEDDCFQLTTDDQALTPVGLQVRSVLDVSIERVLFSATEDPQQQHLYVRDAYGTVSRLTDDATVNSAAGNTHGIVIASTDGDSPEMRFRAHLAGRDVDIPSMAERPDVDIAVTFHRVGERSLSAAVLWPTDHVHGERVPVVLAPYGGPNVAEVVRSARAFASEQWLADQGFAVVVIDGRGTPGRGPAWEFEIHRDLATGILQDQVDGLLALAEMYPDLDTSRVGITGWSFGGYLAALAILDRPDVFHAAVAGAPVTDWRLYDTAYSERYLGLPQDNAAAYDASSLLTRAAALSRPLLLIHGMADDNVLAANTLQLSGALLAAGRGHSVLPLAGVTHMTPQEVVAENLLRLEAEFLTTHLR